MKSKAVWVTVLVVAVVLFLGASGEAQGPKDFPKDGTHRGKFGVQGYGTVNELEEGHIFFVGGFKGVFFNDVAGGFMDKPSVDCPGVNDIVDGVSIGNHGYCIVTDDDGDKAFSVWQGKDMTSNHGGGDAQWIGGTGKFAGIKGHDTYRYAGIGNTMGYALLWAERCPVCQQGLLRQVERLAPTAAA
jgi:hypothetical protein